jgi:hypothetical protein
MIQVQELQMNEGTYFIRVTKTTLGEPDDVRVFFDGDSNCIWTYLLSLGLNDAEIETQLNSFNNVKL